MTIIRSATITVLAIVGLFLSTAAVLAYESAATVSLNVRSGPGTSFRVVDTLYAGEPVEVTECASNGWCYIEHTGPDGWVSSKYLSTTTSPGTETTAALPASFAAKVALNVRSGPGTSYGVVDILYAGEVVKVTKCVSNGWCYIEHTGPDGWVSSNYLKAAPDINGGSPDPSCSIRFTIGPDGPSLSIICGDRTFPPTPPSRNQACFYVGPNFSGSSFCSGIDRLNSLSSTFDNRISSVKLYGSASVRLCSEANLGGLCRTVTSDTALLGAFINNRASSLLVFTGAWPIVPEVYSSGSINLQQSYTANLDSGAIGWVGADIWYRAILPVSKSISPRNGALLAQGDGSNRGFTGCNAATFTDQPIPVGDIPVGTYVCVKTNQGRISQFRLDGYAGTTMKLSYTTWAN